MVLHLENEWSRRSTKVSWKLKNITIILCQKKKGYMKNTFSIIHQEMRTIALSSDFPVHLDAEDLCESCQNALKSLQHIERRFSKNPELKEVCEVQVWVSLTGSHGRSTWRRC
jgi:hypothetical protein